jgi:hypothetical protein
VKWFFPSNEEPFLNDHLMNVSFCLVKKKTFVDYNWGFLVFAAGLSPAICLDCKRKKKKIFE